MSYFLCTKFEYSLFPVNTPSRSFWSFQSIVLIKWWFVIPPLVPIISLLVEKSSHNKQSEMNLFILLTTQENQREKRNLTPIFVPSSPNINTVELISA